MSPPIYMNNYLQNIPTTIATNEDDYYVIYQINNISGYCSFNKWESKLQPKGSYILTNVNMTDIINYINEKSPLNDGDLINLQMEIRTHSLLQLRTHFSQGSLSHT